MQNVDHLHECKKFYNERLRPIFGVPKGAVEAEIIELQEVLGLNLPTSYQQFLLWMGHDNRGALKGSEWFIDNILDNQIFLEEFLVDNCVTTKIFEQRFCFFCHQGYIAAWFSVDGEINDPLCEFYSESDPNPVASDAGQFSAFLLKELKGIAEVV